MKSRLNGDLGSRLPTLLDDAMKSAGIEAENLERISQQPGRQTGRGDLSEVPLQAVFREITLRQLLLFLTTLSGGDAAIGVTELHLSYPAGILSKGPAATWNSEITISHLVYSPPGTGTSSSSAN